MVGCRPCSLITVNMICDLNIVANKIMLMSIISFSALTRNAQLQHHCKATEAEEVRFLFPFLQLAVHMIMYALLSPFDFKLV